MSRAEPTAYTVHRSSYVPDLLLRCVVQVRFINATFLWLAWRGRKILEKTTVFHLVDKKSSTLYWIWSLFIVCACTRHWFVSWVTKMHSTPFHTTCFRFILILSSHLRPVLTNVLVRSGFQTKSSCCWEHISLFLHVPSVTYCFNQPNNIRSGEQVIEFLTVHSFASFHSLFP